jgi:hypothetical protein
MELQYGTEKEHRATLQRAKDNRVWKIWSGDVRRNPYLRENMIFAERVGIAKFTPYNSYEQQESGWVIEWLS